MDMATALIAATNSMAVIGQSDKTDCPQNILLPGSQVQDDEQKGFDDVLKLQKPNCRNLVEELTAWMPDTEICYAYGYPKYGADTSHFEEDLKMIEDANLVLLTLGGKWGSGSICTMGEGIDTMDIGLPECQEKFIAAAAELGKPMLTSSFKITEDLIIPGKTRKFYTIGKVQ